MLGATSALGLGAVISPATAQEAAGEATPAAFSAPSGPLGQTLIAIAKAFGADVVAADDLVAGRSSPPVVEALTLEDALAQALQGSNLEARPSAGGSYVIGRRAASVDPIARPMIDDQIIVTARFQQSLIDRLPISPQELPFTLNTLSREDIDARGFIRPIEVLDTLPNVQLGGDAGYGNPNFLVRGFDAPILVNNRVTNPGRAPGQPDDVFVDRYEVLKGPASIALGPISGGGVINAITKLPEQEDFIDLRVAADQFGSVRGEFDYNEANLFGSDAFSFRLSGAMRDFEFDAEEVDRQEFAIRPVLLFDAGGPTTANISVGYKRVEAVPNVSFPIFDDGSVPEQFGTDTFFGFANAFVEGEDLSIDSQIRHDFLDGLTLTLRGSYQSTDSSYQDRGALYAYNAAGFSPENPYVYGFSLIADFEEETIFLDAQLLYTFDFAGLDQSIVVGASYDEGGFDFFQNRFGFVGPFLIDDIDLPRIGNPQASPPSEPTSFGDQTLHSVYAEVVVRPFERLSIVGGVRYDDNKDALGLPIAPQFSRTLRENEVTARVGASFEITESINAFASWAEAFTPQSGITRTGEQVGAERSENFEAGIKGSLFDGVLGFDFGVFSTTRLDVAVDDLEAPVDPDDPFASNFRITIGEQVNRGIEANFNLVSESGLRLDVGYGYLDQEIKASAQGEISVRNFPDHQLSAFGAYTVPKGVLDGASIGGGVRYFSSRPSSSPTFEFPSVTVADAFASVPLRRDTTAQLNVLNIFDNEYLESSGFGNTQGLQTFGAPRTIILSVRTRF
ncbi:MAG: TonB-dependent receptor [Pseudomonadota bacterium]